MLNEKTPGSVWNVAFIAIALFVTAMALAGVVTGEEASVVSAKM